MDCDRVLHPANRNTYCEKRELDMVDAVCLLLMPGPADFSFRSAVRGGAAACAKGALSALARKHSTSPDDNGLHQMGRKGHVRGSDWPHIPANQQCRQRECVLCCALAAAPAPHLPVQSHSQGSCAWPGCVRRVYLPSAHTVECAKCNQRSMLVVSVCLRSHAMLPCSVPPKVCGYRP